MKKRLFEKGNVSNLISFALLVIGLVGRSIPFPGNDWILAAGLFGFAGGVTNWLAVKMLFDKVPLLYGSGVIPGRFREIRETIRDLIMRHFFAEEYLQRFFSAHTDALSDNGQLAEKVAAILESEEVDAAIERKFAELVQSPIGMMLQMVGPEKIKPIVHQFIGGIGQEIAPDLAAEFAGNADVAALRGQVDQLLAAKLEELTPETVKQMMEDVIREHLGWLIVWGNLFGATIGLLARAFGY